MAKKKRSVKKGEVKPVTLAYVDDHVSNPLLGQPQPVTFNDLYSWFKRSPEVVGMTRAIVDDVMGEGFDLVGDQKAVSKAESWMFRNQFKKKLAVFVQDFVITGNAYFGKTKLSTDDVKEVLDSVSRDFSVKSEVKQKVYLNVCRKLMKQNVFNEPRELFNIKSSTIRINYDVHGVVHGYVQSVPEASMTPIEFLPDSIIHFSLDNLGDSPYGFSAFAASLNEVAVLWYAKDYAGKFFENDASVNRIWILKNETPESGNYKKFVEQLKDAKSNKQKHMVLTGEIEQFPINDFNKDLEFANLIDKFTQRLMMAWGVPPSRVSHISGNARSNVESVEGYSKKINRIQEQLEELMNGRVFSDFGNVQMKFRRVYKRDESREADIVNKLVGRPVLTVNEGRSMLGKLPVSDPAYDVIPAKQSLFGNPSPEDGPEIRDEQQKASEELISRKSEKKVVGWNMFRQIVTSTTRMPFDNARVLYRELEDRFELFFSDSNHEYKTIIPKAEVDVDDFKTRFLSNAIPLMGIEVDRPVVNVDVR